MVQVVKIMARLVVSVVACVSLLFGFGRAFLPSLIINANAAINAKTESLQLEELTVFYLTVQETANSTIILDDVLERIASENTTPQLDELFWNTIQLETERVSTYCKNTNNVYVEQALDNIDSSKNSEWKLFMIATNESGVRCKVEVDLQLIGIS